MTQPEASMVRLSWRQVLGYGLGDAANNMVFSMGLLFLLHYYTDVAGISAAVAGLVLASVRIYDAVMDLLAGRIIDRYTGTARFGRLRPFLLWGALLLLLNVAVFSVPADWSNGGRIAWATISYALLGTAYAFVNIPYGSLASVLTQHPRERARLSAARTFAGTLTVIALAFLVGPMLHTLQGAALQSWITRFTLMLALVGTLLYLICFLSTREVVERRESQPDWRRSLAALRRNRPLHILCGAALCLLAGSASGSATSLYFARYVLGDAGQLLTLILCGTVLSLLVTVPLAAPLVSRFGKKRCFQTGIALAALSHLALLVVPPSLRGVIFALLGLGSAGAMLALIVMWAMEADTVEYGEWLTGARLEGTNYAIFSLTRKCGLALGGAIPAFLLAAADYVPNAVQQSAQSLQAIRNGMALVPALAFALAGLIMSFHPLSDKRFLALLEEVRARRER